MTATTWERSPERPPDDDPPAAPAQGEHGWLPWTAPVALVSALIVATVGGLIAAIAATPFGYSFDQVGDPPPGVILSATFIQDIGFVAMAVVFARMTGPVVARHFGLRPTRALTAFGWALVAYAAFFVFLAVWSSIIGLGSSETEDQLDNLGVRDSDAALVAGALLVCVVAPVVEELFFRGFFFAALRNWKGPLLASILTGLVFGGIHFGGADAGALLPLGFLGFALCWLYQRTGSLYPCIGVHAFNNAIAFATANDWTWQMPLVLAGSLAGCAAVVVLGSRLFPRSPLVD